MGWWTSTGSDGGWIKAVAAGAAYVGPGNVVPSALAWYGLRAYSAATAGGNAVRLIRASDSTQQDFVTLANGNLDIASIATFLAATTGKVVTWYDQTGNGRHVTQATDANRPDYAAAVLGSLPAVQFTAASTQSLVSGNLTLSQPLSISMVANRTTASAAYCRLGGDSVSGNSSTNILADAGNTIVGVTTINAFHATQVWLNGVSSQFYIDGSLTPASPADAGTNGTGGQPITIGLSGASAFSGYIAEWGIWNSAFTGNSTLNSNQRAYWGF